MVKKYLIRIVGALCILGALALMFLSAWVELDGIARRDLRSLRSDVSGICTAVTESFVNMVERSDDFKDELKDYDLPYTRGTIKSRFKDVNKLTEELLNDTVSLKELLILSVKAPGLLKDTENLLDSEGASKSFFSSAARFILYEGSQATGEEYDSQRLDSASDQLMETMEDGLDILSDFSFAFILLAGALILIVVLGVVSAITHICNKGRWGKYLFLVVLAGLVAGSCVAFPVVSDMLTRVLVDAPAFKDMVLKITITPFIAVVLTIVPIVLDIIYERKKETITAEESSYGK